MDFIYQLIQDARVWSKYMLHGLSAAAPLGAVVVFAIALGQYVRSENWKKTEFVAKLFKEFSENEDCRHARWMLEGDPREITYKCGEKFERYLYNFDELSKAIDSVLRKGPLSAQQLHMLDSFDGFFIYIEQFERAIQRKLVEQDDVYPYLGYWIGVLSGHAGWAPPESILARIHAYIKHGGFDDVEKFLHRRWDDSDPNQANQPTGSHPASA
ncbi:hypothetical protein [Bradyrhizobium sp. CCBAU 53421]|uniref:hypothetical protein n=1 Tax=Bradyrhizobium sp. CCBAU 53421 TaxID=1325120 RepID=UPI00188C9923|nr:hypothetical protein [Bradyrhizobium sp. CCBAU 53421]QOZ36476.1 hypothetical protein XH92_36820 [Bradyrhizobium sp. CCBAU 53421]